VTVFYCCRRPQWPRCLRRGSATARIPELRVPIPVGVLMSLVSSVCCQLEVSSSGRSLVQRSPTQCGVSECDLETSWMRRPWPTGGLLRHEKTNLINIIRMQFLAGKNNSRSAVRTLRNRAACGARLTTKYWPPCVSNSILFKFASNIPFAKLKNILQTHLYPCLPRKIYVFTFSSLYSSLGTFRTLRISKLPYRHTMLLMIQWRYHFPQRSTAVLSITAAVSLFSSYYLHPHRERTCSTDHLNTARAKLCTHNLSEQAVLWCDVAVCGTAVPSAARIQYCLFLPTDMAVLRKNENIN
jgi:hypothetical protein